MSRSTDFLGVTLQDKISATLGLVELLEQNKENAKGSYWSISLPAIETFHEVAFLRIFGYWESFLEQLFFRLMCGYETSHGPESLPAGKKYFRSIQDASLDAHGSRNYLSWYVPSEIVGRSRKYFDGGNFEMTIASASTILADHSVMRHQISHVQDSRIATRSFVTIGPVPRKLLAKPFFRAASRFSNAVGRLRCCRNRNRGSSRQSRAVGRGCWPRRPGAALASL